MLSLAHTSSMVILSLRGMLRNSSKSTGDALRPTLPLLRLQGQPECYLQVLFYLASTGAELHECVHQIEQQQLLYLSCLASHCCFLPTKLDKLAF